MNKQFKSIYRNRVVIGGFSIVELMTSLGIIGILITVANVVYPSYVARSQLVATVRLLEGYIKDAQRLYSELPSNPSFAKIAFGGYIPDQKSIIRTITPSVTPDAVKKTETFSLTAYFNPTNAHKFLINSNNTRSITLSVTVDSSGLFSVVCSSFDISSDYLPSLCQGNSP